MGRMGPLLELHGLQAGQIILFLHLFSLHLARLKKELIWPDGFLILSAPIGNTLMEKHVMAQSTLLTLIVNPVFAIYTLPLE